MEDKLPAIHNSLNDSDLIKERAAWIEAAVDVVTMKICIAIFASGAGSGLIMLAFELDREAALFLAIGASLCLSALVGAWTAFNAREYAKIWTVTPDRF